MFYFRMRYCTSSCYTYNRHPENRMGHFHTGYLYRLSAAIFLPLMLSLQGCDSFTHDNDSKALIVDLPAVAKAPGSDAERQKTSVEDTQR